MTFGLLDPPILATGKSFAEVPAEDTLLLLTRPLLFLPVGEKWVPGSVVGADFRQAGLAGKC